MTGPPLQHPLQLGDGALGDGQVDDRRGVDPALVVEAPLVVEPLVEGVDEHLGAHRVVHEADLEQRGERREVDDGLDVHAVHQGEAGVAVGELGDGPHGSHDLAIALALGVATREVLGRGARLGDDLEGGVGDVVGDLAPHDHLGAAVDLGQADQPLVLLRQVARERVPPLVEVEVAVEHRVAEVRERHVRAVGGVLHRDRPPGASGLCRGTVRRTRVGGLGTKVPSSNSHVTVEGGCERCGLLTSRLAPPPTGLLRESTASRPAIGAPQAGSG